MLPFFRMVLPSWTGRLVAQILPPSIATLSLNVLLVMVPLPEIPPPRPCPTVVMLPLIVQLEMVPPP